MRSKGCWDARTIHSLIYQPREKGTDRLQTLQLELGRYYEEGVCEESLQFRSLLRQIEDEKKAVKSPHFELNLDSDLASASLLIVDEISMVGGKMVDDLLYFRVPILVLGDPAQLPPVASAGYFTKREPDVLLTEIHRQAKDDPIIRMSMDVREGRGLQYGTYGESSVIRLADFDPASINGAQMLVGLNETRRKANAFCRAKRGFTGQIPVVGDRLVCLRNNHELGLLNGTLWNVDSVGAGCDDLRTLGLTGEEGQSIFVEAFDHPFKGEEIPHWLRREAEHFEYGYCLTVHKAQGSEWDDVLLRDESACFRQDADRWLYTGITRAAKKVTVVR
jgi:exodeoxyribonuclease-5